MGDLGETMTGNIVSERWNFVSSAIERLDQAIEGKDGMILDGDVANVSAMSARQIFLTYTVKRVCNLLEKNEQKRLDPMQVNLVEGMKYVAVRAKRLNDSDTLLFRLANQYCGSSGGSVAIDLLKSGLIQ